MGKRLINRLAKAQKLGDASLWVSSLEQRP
jgi:hypothetical protein